MIQAGTMEHVTIWQKKGEYAISITFFCETYAHIDKWSEREIPFDLSSQRKRNKFMDILKRLDLQKNSVGSNCPIKEFLGL